MHENCLYNLNDYVQLCVTFFHGKQMHYIAIKQDQKKPIG